MSNGPIGEDCHTGTSWHLPNWPVEYPFSFSVSASGALVFERQRTSGRAPRSRSR